MSLRRSIVTVVGLILDPRFEPDNRHLKHLEALVANAEAMGMGEVIRYYRDRINLIEERMKGGPPKYLH